jgi:aryl-alcohol dehydrogenase-like predicted oxidoreductase
MDYRVMGTTGVKVSTLCMGTMTFGRNDWGLGSLDQAAVNDMVAACLDHGINFFDTADIYSYGNSEEVLGQAIKGRRDKLVIATKVRARMSEDVNDIGLSRRHIMNAVDRSLARLGTDHIDLYQLHGWDELTPLEETLSTLDMLVRAGKVRYTGCSNFTGWQIERAMQLGARHGWISFQTVQPLYNLVARDIEHEMLPVCRDHRLGVLPWSPLAGSFLTGKYRKGRPRPEGSRRSDPEKVGLPIDEEASWKIVDAVIELAAARRVSPAQVALNWVRAKPQVTSVIIGARTMEQLLDNLGTVTWELTPEEMAHLDAVSERPAPYPVWFIRNAHKTR